MPAVHRAADVEPDENDVRRIWRMLYPDRLGSNPGAVAGVVEYKHRTSAPTDDELGGGHERAEFYYVLSGAGVVGEPGTTTTIEAGDAFVIDPGVRHSIWSSSPEQPVVTFFVSLKG